MSNWRKCCVPKSPEEQKTNTPLPFTDLLWSDRWRLARGEIHRVIIVAHVASARGRGVNSWPKDGFSWQPAITQTPPIAPSGANNEALSVLVLSQCACQHKRRVCYEAAAESRLARSGNIKKHGSRAIKTDASPSGHAFRRAFQAEKIDTHLRRNNCITHILSCETRGA